MYLDHFDAVERKIIEGAVRYSADPYPDPGANLKKIVAKMAHLLREQDKEISTYKTLTFERVDGFIIQNDNGKIYNLLPKYHATISVFNPALYLRMVHMATQYGGVQEWGASGRVFEFFTEDELTFNALIDKMKEMLTEKPKDEVQEFKPGTLD